MTRRAEVAPVRVSIVQTGPAGDDLEVELERAVEAIRSLPDGTALILFPELFARPFWCVGLADRAYFANTVLVCAVNNLPGPSYPSLFASVVSVAAHDVADPDVWFYNPEPPVEFGAYGLDVDVAWRDGGRIRATGNSFAAPHLAGQAARLRSRYPAASPFEIKTLLAATANDPG